MAVRREGEPDLAADGVQQAVHDILVRGVGEATPLPGLLVLLVPLAQPLGAKVEGIPERLVDAVEDIRAGHEDTLKGGRAGPRVSGHKDGLVRHGGKRGERNWWIERTRRQDEGGDQTTEK